MDKIVDRFNRDFAHWGIRLSLDAAKERGRGKIVKAGWAIWYRFGADANGEYLDYYSAHRMTDDRHTRVYEDGQIENLPTTRTMYRVTDDPEENARIKARFDAQNREIAAMLTKKGFKISVDEPGAVQINRFLWVWPEGKVPIKHTTNKGGLSVADLKPGTYTTEFQSEFLKGEIQFLTLQAALSTRNRDFPVYAKGVSSSKRTQFRKRLVEILDRVAINYIPGNVSLEDHCYYLRRLSRAMKSRGFSKLLHGDTFRVGVAQKALNLYLKYLWCLGEIDEPPHCPFDNFVIRELKDCEEINWTEFDDIKTYKYLVQQAEVEAGELSLAEWELRVFNRRQ